MPKIKIIVACHKPSELPNNSLFLPVQVGAANSTLELGIQKDNDGQNISKKNPQYCELTAQYWAWKNLDADYYGLCHYRRFLCFKETKDKKNNRNQIEANEISEYTKNKFGLEDELTMSRVIEKNDVVAGLPQIVKNLYTPHGAKRTAYEHWVAHDRALIMREDLDLMLDILEKYYPELGKDAREYLSSKTFLGFNCFVMKKKFFFEMCEMEFKVLEELEKKVDISNYGQQLSRIYGFMGEILSSAYIYHIEKNKKYKVKHVPIVYFNYTDKIKDFEPKYPNDKMAIPILFNCADNIPIKFGVIWKSFLNNIDQNHKYDVIIFIDNVSEALRNIYVNMCGNRKNVSVRFIDVDVYRKRLTEQYNLVGNKTITEKMTKADILDGNNYLSVLPYAPYILKKYNKMLVFDENIIFNDSVSKLWDEANNHDELISATHGVFILSGINDVYPETADLYLSSFMKNPYDYFCISAMVMRFDKYRSLFSEEKIAEAYKINNNKKLLRYKDDILNLLCEGDVNFIDQRWNTWLDSNEYLKNRLPYMPLQNLNDLKNARKNPGIIHYTEYDPWEENITDLYQPFWNIAKETPLYVSYIDYYHTVRKIKKLMEKVNVTAKMFPPDSKMRVYMTRMFPKGSKRYKAAKATMNFLKIK